MSTNAASDFRRLKSPHANLRRRPALPCGYEPPDYRVVPVRLADGTLLHVNADDLDDPRYVNVRNLSPDGVPVPGRAGLQPRAVFHGAEVLAEPWHGTEYLSRAAGSSRGSGKEEGPDFAKIDPAEVVEKLFQQAERAGVRLTPQVAEGLSLGDPRVISYVADMITHMGGRPEVQPRYEGGDVVPGKKYVVNEMAPENVVGSDGAARPVGDGRPAVVQARQAGVILPGQKDHGLAGLRAAPSLNPPDGAPPYPAGRRLTPEGDSGWVSWQELAGGQPAGAPGQIYPNGVQAVPGSTGSSHAGAQPGFSDATVRRLAELAPKVRGAAKLWNVDPAEMLFSIGEEYDTRTGLKWAEDEVQDWLAAKGLHSGVPGHGGKGYWGADVGPANFAVHNAQKLLDYYDGQRDPRLIQRGNSPDIPDGNVAKWLTTDDGTAYATAMHLRRYHDQFDPLQTPNLSDEERQRMAVMFFRQGDNFVDRYASTKRRENPGLRVEIERDEGAPGSEKRGRLVEPFLPRSFVNEKGRPVRLEPGEVTLEDIKREMVEKHQFPASLKGRTGFNIPRSNADSSYVEHYPGKSGQIRGILGTR